MDSKELRGLYEAYKQVNAPQEIDEAEKPFPHEKVKAKQVALRDKGGNALDRRMKMGMAVRRAKEAEKTGGSQRDAGKGWYHAKEELDIFDVVLEFLQVEGFAETLEEAEWMMVNVIDEEAIDIILGEASRADDTTRANIARYAGKKGISFEPGPNWDPSANRGRGAHLNPKQKEKQRRKALRQEEYMDEAQEARNNPEKYEREQSKKTAPVRGEKTPMPPRGDKRREDFEKWYAKQMGR